MKARCIFSKSQRVQCRGSRVSLEWIFGISEVYCTLAIERVQDCYEGLFVVVIQGSPPKHASNAAQQLKLTAAAPRPPQNSLGDSLVIFGPWRVEPFQRVGPKSVAPVGSTY